jgi:hypothetical protein
LPFLGTSKKSKHNELQTRFYSNLGSGVLQQKVKMKMVVQYIVMVALFMFGLGFAPLEVPCA